jgi:O-acetylhomoserine (thiol)-lyase
MTNRFPENFSTLAVHGSLHTHGAHKTPIHTSAAYEQGSIRDAELNFSWQDINYTYARSGTPTDSSLEQKLIAMDGGISAVTLASGQAAVFAAIEPFLQNPGDRIALSPHAFGGTHGILNGKLSKFGYHIDWFDPTDANSLNHVITDKTKAVVTESISNPDNVIADLDNLSKVTRQHHIPFVVDNTLATPYLLQPIKHGADIVVYSATKYLNGHGNAVSGLVVDSGDFTWDNDPRYKLIADHAQIHGALAYSIAVRQTMTSFGFSPSPFNSFLTEEGLATLPLRMKQHTHNAQAVAEFLDNHDDVSWVKYAGLKSDPNYKSAQHYLPKGVSGVMSFKLKDGYNAADQFINNLQLVRHGANIGQINTLVVYPDKTTHRQLAQNHKDAIGIGDGVLRLSVGIEDTQDIISDIAQALKPRKPKSFNAAILVQ